MKTINVKIILVALFLAGVSFLTSCSHKERESVQIFIHNKTDSLVHIRLYPKAEYLSEDLYRRSDGLSGYDGRCEFTLSANSGWDNIWWHSVFGSYDLSLMPYHVAAKAFDSIYITMGNTLLKFIHDTVIGYSENIFADSSTWDYRIIESHKQTGFMYKTFDKAHCYIFPILESKIITEKDQ